jgi:hypothetical protein
LLQSGASLAHVIGPEGEADPGAVVSQVEAELSHAENETARGSANGLVVRGRHPRGGTIDSRRHRGPSHKATAVHVKLRTKQRKKQHMMKSNEQVTAYSYDIQQAR